MVKALTKPQKKLIMLLPLPDKIETSKCQLSAQIIKAMREGLLSFTLKLYYFSLKLLKMWLRKDKSCVLFPDKNKLSILTSIAFGGAKLGYTAWRLKPSQFVLGLKNTFAIVKGEMY